MTGLLVLGRLSNHLGRRIVSVAALAVTAAGCLVLLDVHSAAPLIGGRALEGSGAALASSAIGVLLSGRLSPAGAQRVGMRVFFLAPAVILAVLRLGAVASFVLASAVAGAAQGATFAGSLRALLAEARPADAQDCCQSSTRSATPEPPSPA